MPLHGRREFADGLDELGHGHLETRQACPLFVHGGRKLQEFFRQDVSSEFLPQFRMLFNEFQEPAKLFDARGHPSCSSGGDCIPRQGSCAEKGEGITKSRIVHQVFS